LIKDLDVEMEKRNVDSILVFGDSTVGNPELRYVAGTSLARGGIFLKRRSHDPTLIVSNIDVGSARQGKIRNIKTYSDYGYERIASKYDRDEARIRFYQKILKDEGTHGQTILAGRNDVSNTLNTIDALRRKGLKILGEKSPTIIETARETKDRWEIERLKLLGKKTTRVVEETLRFLRGARVVGKRVSYKSKPLSVGVVRKVIGRLLSEENLVAPEDTIFAPGIGSSDPHYRGDDDDIVRAGEPIVFDLFPSEPDGYWHDCTRTYLFGSAPKKVKEMYDAVLEVQNSALDMVREQVACRDMMMSACKIFEKKGYPTARQLVKGNKEARVRGFTHGLGHGVGLTIGERPYLVLYGKDHLKKGSVVTIEPGLYEPRWGGVRIEDTVIVGSPSENITPLSKDIEL
jgi:Xaa-Pro aminopeptidase